MFLSREGGGGTPYKTYGEAPPQRAPRIWKGCDFTSWALYAKLGKSVISVCSKKAQKG